jgi:cell division protein FtsZ
LIDEFFDNLGTELPKPSETIAPESKVASEPAKPANTPLPQASKQDSYQRPFAEPDLISSTTPSPAPATQPLAAKSEANPTPTPASPPVPEALQPKPEVPALSPKEPKIDLASALQLKVDSKSSSDQDELSFKKTPRGRFEGENPNVVDGEDLDLPPFLRKKK